MKWMFGKKLHDLMSSLGLEWEIVESIPRDDLGSSPSHIYWTGDRFIIEKSCPKAWVAHDIAHHLVQRVEDPDNLHKPNWGFNEPADSAKLDREEELESLAADLTITLLSRLNLPWHRAAIHMDIPDPVPGLWDTRTRAQCLNRTQWKMVREWCEKRSAPYLEGVL